MVKGDKLTNQDKKFVKEIVETGNQTLAAKRAYNIKTDEYAGKKGSLQVRKGKIQKAILSIADAFSNEEVVEKHKELLNSLNLEKLPFDAHDTDEEIESIINRMPGYELLYIKEYTGADNQVTSKYAYVKSPDNMARDKALDKVYKLKGAYAADKTDITSQGEKIIIMPSELIKKNENSNTQ